jgi:hypothetical protein
MIFYGGKVPKEFQKYLKDDEKQNKYKNKKVSVDGKKFDSFLEAKRYSQLRLLEKAGDITDLRTQVKYVLIPSQKRKDGSVERECSYIADFVYMDRMTRETVVEDTKSAATKTREYVIKRKLMLHVHGIEIREVTEC